MQPRQLDDTGKLWSPGVRDGVQPGSEFHLTEYFGPVLGIMTAKNLDEAIALQNAVDYGLTAGIHSLDTDEVARWMDTVQAGNLYINRVITGAIVRRQPFGGWKRSGVGPGAKVGGPEHPHRARIVEADRGAADRRPRARRARPARRRVHRGLPAGARLRGLRPRAPRRAERPGRVGHRVRHVARHLGPRRRAQRVPLPAGRGHRAARRGRRPDRAGARARGRRARAGAAARQLAGAAAERRARARDRAERDPGCGAADPRRQGRERRGLARSRRRRPSRPHPADRRRRLGSRHGRSAVRPTSRSGAARSPRPAAWRCCRSSRSRRSRSPRTASATPTAGCRRSSSSGRVAALDVSRPRARAARRRRRDASRASARRTSAGAACLQRRPLRRRSRSTDGDERPAAPARLDDAGGLELAVRAARRGFGPRSTA